MATLLILRDTKEAPQGDTRYQWRRLMAVEAFEDDHEFGLLERPESGNFYHIIITNKTLAEVKEYVGAWRHDPTTTQVQANGDQRLIEVVSDMVRADGTFAFDRPRVEALLANIGGTYQSHTNNSFRFSITATVEERDRIVAQIDAAVRHMQQANARWYLSAEGEAAIIANGGTISGRANQVAKYLQDALITPEPT